jgi:hypothetical protein
VDRKQTVTVVGLLMATLALLPTRAMSQRAVSRTELSGEWSGSIALDAGTQTVAAVFRVTDTTIAGTVYLDGKSFGDMDQPRLSRDTVHFKVGQLDFTGVIAGSTMKVDLIVFNGSTRRLTLKKIPDARDDRTEYLHSLGSGRTKTRPLRLPP